MALAHPQPTLPGAWHDSSANPQRSYTLLNKESPEFIRFVNPSDYRVAREACGACHLEVIEATERSLMSTSAMLWGGAAYNNGIVPYKNYVFGEAYTRTGKPACILSPSSRLTAEEYKEACKPEFGFDKILTDEEKKRGALAKMYPLPRWSVIPPGDVFRVFERGGRNIATQFPEIGLPNPTRQHPAARGTGPSRPQAVEPRPRHRAARRDPGAQHPQDAPQRSADVVHGHQRPAGRLSPFGLFGLPRRLCQRPRAAPQPDLCQIWPRRRDRHRRSDDPREIMDWRRRSWRPRKSPQAAVIRTPRIWRPTTALSAGPDMAG